MALVLLDRVQQTGTANTTVSFTLTGSVTGFQSFAGIGNGNTTFYEGTDASGNWETGLGTYSSTGPTLTRTAILQSSNANAAVTFSGTVNVFVTYPSSKSVNLDSSGNVSPLGTVASGTWQGTTIGVTYGGTGVTSSSGANSVVLRDADQNIAANSLTQTLTKTTSAGGTTTLSTASSHFQVLTGTSAQTYKLPDATSLPVGSTWVFDNDSTQNLTIQDNALTTIDVVAPGGYTTVVLEANGTVAGEWIRYGMLPSEVNWGTNSLDLGGTTVITNGTWQGTTIASGYGGTGLTTFTAANNALYSTSAGALTAGTLPVAAGGTGLTSLTANYIPYGNGTGNYQSSSTFTFNGTTLTAPAATLSGNLTFSGTGRRIIADYSSGTLLNLMMFQTSTSNGITKVGAIPAGTNTTAQYDVYNSSDPRNASTGTFGVTSTALNISSDITGTGTYKPMTFYTGGSEKFRIAADTTGTYTFGGTAPRITGDFSNATESSRVLFQTSTSNNSTYVGVIPNGTGNITGSIYYGSTDTANANYLGIINIGATEARIIAGAAGSGTNRPMVFYTNGSERLRMTLNGGIAFGGSTNYGTTGQVLQSNGDAPPTWVTSSGGGPVADGCIYENSLSITSNYTFTTGKNGMSVGPITIASGVSVTVPSGQRWVVL